MNIKRLPSKPLIDALNSYDCVAVNSLPSTEKELYDYYVNNTDPVISWARKITDDNIFVLGNEIRAMFGHLADYRQDPTRKKNLENAYGHFRRLNIDTFKILCDEFDKFFLIQLKKYYHLDLRNIDRNYLEDFSNEYFNAKDAYIEAQQKEHVGSDMHENIILLYHKAASCYAKVYKNFYENAPRGLKWLKIKTITKDVGAFIISVAGLLIYFLS